MVGSFLVSRPWTRPWPLLIAGLCLSAVACLLSRWTELPGYVPISLLFTGTLLAGAAVVQRLRRETWEWGPGLIESAAVVSLSGLVSILGYVAMRPEWLSGRMFYTFLTAFGLIGAVLTLLPSLLRRVAISLLVLFHFTGMAVCVTSIDPPGNSGLFLSKQLWTWVYRPYLSFMYMTNAYHFYSPDPGHPELLWFAIQYDDGSYTWVKLPERSNSPIGMHYQRMLALPAHSYAGNARLPFSAAELAMLPKKDRPKQDSWEAIYLRRQLGSTIEYRRREEPKFLPIPLIADMDLNTQYREPNEMSKKALSSVARRAFLTAPPSRDENGNVKPGVKVKSVKLYRVVNLILSPQELAQGISPLEKTKHWPYFLGEYDGDGNIIDERDPFLYWLLPIAVVPSRYPNLGPGSPSIYVRNQPKEGFLLDCVEMHAAGRRPARAEEKN